MHSKMFKRILAGILIFTLTFANPALVTKSFATSIFDKVSNQTGKGNKNIEFNAGFDAENAESFSAISDVNNDNLAINLNVNVKNKGYLKNGKVQILEGTEGTGLNFELKNQTKESVQSEEVSEEANEAEQVTENLPDMVEKIEDNVVTLKQITAGSDISISLPIEYKNEEFVNLSKLVGNSKILFTGVYVDEKGNEIEVAKEVDLTLSWKDERTAKISSEIAKYIPYSTSNGNGIILQTIVDLDNTTTNKTLPVNKTELNISVPTIGNNKPSKITVVANSTAGTNGKDNENVIFTEDNWSYDQETGILNIKMQNDKQLVKIDNNENDKLNNAEQ